jgi:hypothetical protein
MKRAISAMSAAAPANQPAAYSPPVSPRNVSRDVEGSHHSQLFASQNAFDMRQSLASQATTPHSQRAASLPDHRSPANTNTNTNTPSFSHAQDSPSSVFFRELKLSLERGFPLAVSDGRNGPVITFKGRQFTLDDATPFVSYDGKGEPYSIRAVLECVRTFDLGYMDYLTYTKRSNLPRVLLVDRQKLLEDLLGTSPSQANVETCLRDL